MSPQMLSAGHHCCSLLGLGAWINDPDPAMARVSWFNKMEQCKSVQFCFCHFPIPSEQFNYVMNRCGSLELEEDITRGR